jgi:predicted phosphodiesterase
MEEADYRGTVTPLPPNPVNLAINAHWNKMLASIRKSPPDVVIFNGDLIEGDQGKEKGRGLMTLYLDVQVEAAIKGIQQIRDILPKVPFYFTAGTDYHQMSDKTSADQHIAKEFGGEYGDELVIEECGIRIFARHTISSSMSTWQYMATAPGRDHMLLYLNKGEEKYGKIDVAVFSHRHQFVAVQFSSGIALVTPCWQSKTPYAVKRGMVGVPEIGWVMLHIDDPKKITVDTSGIATVVKPCKVVGRDGKR